MYVRMMVDDDKNISAEHKAAKEEQKKNETFFGKK